VAGRRRGQVESPLRSRWKLSMLRSSLATQHLYCRDNPAQCSLQSHSDDMLLCSGLAWLDKDSWIWRTARTACLLGACILRYWHGWGVCTDLLKRSVSFDCLTEGKRRCWHCAFGRVLIVVCNVEISDRAKVIQSLSRFQFHATETSASSGRVSGS
jgi:hypothetical protein